MPEVKIDAFLGYKNVKDMYRGARRAVDKGANGFVDEPSRRPDTTYHFTVDETDSDDDEMPAGEIRIYKNAYSHDQGTGDIAVHAPYGRDDQVYGLDDTGYERALVDLIERSEHMEVA